MENNTLSWRQKSNVFDGVNTGPVVKSKIGWHYVAFRSWTNPWHWGFYNYLNHMRTDLYHGSQPLVTGSKKIRAYLGTHKGAYHSNTANTWVGCVMKNNMPTMMLEGYVHSVVYGCEGCNVGTTSTSWYHFMSQETNKIRPITTLYKTGTDCSLMTDEELYYDHDIISVLDLNNVDTSNANYFRIKDNMTVLKNPQHMRLGSTDKFFNPNEPIRTQKKGLYFENNRYLFSLLPVILRWDQGGSVFRNYERFFTVEAWIRFEGDKTKQLPKGKIGYIYKIVDSNSPTANTKLALTVTNTYFGVEINTYKI